jgi:death-on-curing protein
VSTWEWVPFAAVLAIHEEQIAEHGGITGIRDKGMIESALARPQNLEAYGNPDAAALAAAYAFGIANNHGFLDGNKRTGFVTAAVFLDMNGYDLTASDDNIVQIMLGVASGEIDEEILTAWFRKFAVKI